MDAAAACRINRSNVWFHSAYRFQVVVSFVCQDFLLSVRNARSLDSRAPLNQRLTATL